MSIHPFRQYPLIQTLALLLLICSASYARAEDSSYLRELNSEADELATFESSPAPADSRENIDQDQRRKKEFETRLKNELKNTFTIYRKLTTPQKLLVVESYYASGKKIPVASRQIFDIYFNEGNK